VHRVVQGSDFTREGLLNPNIKLELADVDEYGDAGQQLTDEEIEVKAAEEEAAAPSKCKGRSFEGHGSLRRPN
jgi:hypothetical protein